MNGPWKRCAAALLLCGMALACTAFVAADAPASGRLVAAYRCHYAGAVLLGLMGLAYLGRREFMPYHAVAIGKLWHQLEQAEQTMFLASLRIIGSAWIALAAALVLILRNGFRAGDSWAIYGVPLVGLLVAVPTLLVVLNVKFRTPASPPWPPLAVAVGLFLAGLVLSLVADRGA